MTAVPIAPKIYHITHVDNLPSILINGGLMSDTIMMERGGPAESIGMSNIKQRRFTLPVRCHPGNYVADYVPFYFCPRSIMLFLIYRANHPELAYQGGQSPILHLEADLQETVDWANKERIPWAFSLSNASAAYAEFRDRLDQLNEVDWTSVSATDFKEQRIKEGKQAEFLFYRFFPWHLVKRIGVSSSPFGDRVMRAFVGIQHCPTVEVCGTWYF